MDGGEFGGFAHARWRALWRAAFLLTGDAHRAEDLVQAALESTYPHAAKLRTDDERAAYVYRVLTRQFARRPAALARGAAHRAPARDGNRPRRGE